ncbi:MAG: GNAT family protein [Candidatus Faecimonas sp.]|nr:GNAT family N-acetyltransferase [Mycoplasmatota bacterium]MDY2907665.1 GNAT family protein [Candidatus Faecimonas sp.]
MSYYKKIEGDTIYLASINLDDAKEYMQWVNAPNVVFEGYKRENQLTEEEAREELNNMAIENVFAIIDKDTEQFIGLTGFTNTQAMNQRSHMWIKMCTDIAYDSQIFNGVQATDLMLEYAFDIMNLHSVVVDVPIFNQQALDICTNSQLFFMGERKYSSRLGENLYSTVSFQCTKPLYGTKNQATKLNFSNRCCSINGLAVDEANLQKVLNGEHIRLCKYDGQKDYIARMASFLNDPRVSIPLGEYKTNWNDYRAKKHLESVDYVIEKDSDIIGYINLFRKDLYNKTADLEVMIGDVSEQNKGYGTEAVQLFLDEQFKNGPFNSLVSSVFEFNLPSQKLHESIGYQEIGIRPEAYYAYGKLNNMHIYEINRDIYEKRKGKSKKVLTNNSC